AAHRQLRVVLGDEHADLDLGGRDHLYVDPLFGQSPEHALGDAGVAAHADTDDRHLHDVRIGHQGLVVDGGATVFQHLEGTLEVGLGDREGEVGRLAALGHVLHDHVDVDAVVGERPEDGGCDPRPVRDARERDLRLVATVGYAADQFLFHDLFLVDDQGPR